MRLNIWRKGRSRQALAPARKNSEYTCDFYYILFRANCFNVEEYIFFKLTYLSVIQMLFQLMNCSIFQKSSESNFGNHFFIIFMVLCSFLNVFVLKLRKSTHRTPRKGGHFRRGQICKKTFSLFINEKIRDFRKKSFVWGPNSPAAVANFTLCSRGQIAPVRH